MPLQSLSGNSCKVLPKQPGALSAEENEKWFSQVASFCDENVKYFLLHLQTTLRLFSGFQKTAKIGLGTQPFFFCW